MESNEARKSSNPKKIKDKSFKLPIEESIKIIEEVRKIEKQSKVIKPDENRKEYQELLEWVLTKLEASKQSVYEKKVSLNSETNEIENIENETLEEEIHIEQTETIQTLMQEMIEMFKKECKEKSQLMQVCFSYFNQLINSYTKHYENELNETFKTYNIALTKMEDEYEDKITDFKKKVNLLEGEKETKWKNIYMLAKDNRILRRQKGKLLRTIQEQDEKIEILEEEFCQIAKENEMNKLIIRFENDTNNLKVFLKNRIAIMKFEKVLENYPKKAIKVLSNDLLKLEIEELNSLDSKIDYIKRVITESGDIFDEYEDLNELVTKPNIMVFNMFSQTDPEDIEPPVETKDSSINTDSILKHLKISHKLCDFQILNNHEEKENLESLKSDSNQLKNKILARYNEKKKLSSNLQLYSQIFNENINIRMEKKFNHFELFHSASINEKPKFKDKTKLFMMESPKEVDSQLNDQNTYLMSQTLQYEGKKENLVNRKSENLTPKSYAIKNPLLKKNNKSQFSLNATYSIPYSSFENYSQSSKINDTIDEQNQTEENEKSQDLEFKTNSDEDTKNELSSKFKKNKRASRRITEIPSTFERDFLSNYSHELKENEENNESKKKEKLSENINEIQEVVLKDQSKKEVLNVKKSKNTIKKISRVKTTENLRKSTNQTRLVTEMEFIQEEESENEGLNQTKQEKTQVKNRFSYNQILNLPKNFGFRGQSNNLNQLKETYAKEFLNDSKKYRISVNPVDFEGKLKYSDFTSRNSSLNPKFSKRESQLNADTCSVNSFFSNQNEENTNSKTLMAEAKPKESFLVGLESEFVDPIYMKPYEVKKIVEKILKSMYIRRKELLSIENSYSLKNYIEHFLKQLYGEKWRGEKNILRYIFTVYDRETSSDIRVLNLLMNTKVHVEYLEDLFRLYLTMMEKNEYSSAENYLTCSKTKATCILKYLLSIFFDEKTSNEIQQNLSILNNFEVDLNDIFIVVETQLRKYTMQTEIYQFLCNFIPESQSSIEFSCMKELLFLFKNEPNYHTHIVRLKYFFKIHGKIVENKQKNIINKVENSKIARNSKSEKSSNIKKPSSKQDIKPEIEILPLHKVCLYLKRYEWQNLLEINTYVEEKYHETIGVFIEEEAIKFISKYCLNQSEKSNKKLSNLQSGIINLSAHLNPNQQKGKINSLEWLLERSKELIRNHYRYKECIDKHFLMYVHLSILMYELETAMEDVISEPLNLLSMEFKKIKTKEEVDAFLKE